MHLDSMIQLYIAQSIDGYIARENGSIDWLDQLPNPMKTDHGYTAFFEEVKTVVMGRKTYEAILAFDVPWPYTNCKTFVVSNDATYEVHHESISLTTDVVQLVESLKKQPGNTWVVGGGKLVGAFLKADAFDTLIITVIPIMLGAGIPLFPAIDIERWYTLYDAKPYPTGAINLTYQKRLK